MLRFAETPRGEIHHRQYDLAALANNRLGKSTVRDVHLWVPHGRDAEGLPLLFCLAPYLSTGPGQVGWRNFGESIPERLDRMSSEGTLPPCVVVFVDSFNRLGGNQFINSPIFGNWSDALADNLIPQLEADFGCGGAGRRALFGHSSGGYGAFVNLALRPDVWAGAASHAGDCGFDLVYWPEMPKTLRSLEKTDFDVEAFVKGIWEAEKPKGDDIGALMILAMAATYDPAEDKPLGVQLPVTRDTCEKIEERWQKWLDWDLGAIAECNVENLSKSKALYFDCGRQDEYNMIYGTRLLSRQLEAAKVNHRFEEFDGGHGTIGPRYEISLPWLVEKLEA